MFQKLKQFFKSGISLDLDKKSTISDSELQIAVGMLLLQMAGQDEDYAPEEVRSVISMMETQYSLSEDETTELLEVADLVRKDKSRVDTYFKLINEHYTPEQKQLVFAMVWKVVLADGKIDAYEERFATQVKFRLQLTDTQVEEAKEMAAEL